jgi:large subunit ribosomal protein L25
MTSVDVLMAQHRAAAGTGAARATRREGLVPGIVYGNNKDPEMISLDPKALVKEFHKPGFFSRLYTLSVEGKEQHVLAKDVQLHPVTDQVLHIDFQRISKSSKIHVNIPITFINEEKCPGIKHGGVLNVVHHTLEVICPATSIPEGLIVDLSGVGANEGIHINDLKLPKDVVPAHPERDNTIATIVVAVSGEETAASGEGSSQAS